MGISTSAGAGVSRSQTPRVSVASRPPLRPLTPLCAQVLRDENRKGVQKFFK
jgi:hypothetical protein